MKLIPRFLIAIHKYNTFIMYVKQILKNIDCRIRSKYSLSQIQIQFIEGRREISSLSILYHEKSLFHFLLQNKPAG